MLPVAVACLIFTFGASLASRKLSFAEEATTPISRAQTWTRPCPRTMALQSPRARSPYKPRSCALTRSLHPRPRSQARSLHPRPRSQARNLHPRPRSQARSLHPRPRSQTWRNLQ
ncbi:TPA_asm: MC159.1R [Molluscum contagiosum virus]|uniref:MC159.1R n=1 Tax=Molluscum contagiosum virus TaxID=10279 RepID=A0A858A141_9POXV|nr:M159.1 [Molluscum contagiosum virus subtype 1]QHW16904.1 MC159.1R [Molluscum contagiosum virus]AQY17271.1 MC159.1 [Molluscum contagiosum virus subtype 1]AYO88836.1 M159.1 [Molluscum contagiosum virus subtype 1]QHW17086.1 MC159.1R [Molluscum contagiosum virus]